MGRLGRWLAGNAEGAMALAIAAASGILGLLDVFGTDEIDAAVLLVLALIAATLLRGRKLAANALARSEVVRRDQPAGAIIDPPTSCCAAATGSTARRCATAPTPSASTPRTRRARRVRHRTGPVLVPAALRPAAARRGPVPSTSATPTSCSGC